MRKVSSVLAPALFVGSVLFVGTTLVRADDDCQKRTINADHKLHEAIEHHGPNSPQAQHWRQELAESRSYCWDHNHRWWDEDTHHWRTDHDWDDHDEHPDHDHPNH